MIVVTYHNVLGRMPGAFGMLARKEWLALREFAKQVSAIATRYRVVPLPEIVRAVKEGKIITDACAITFDDGCLGAYRYAAPLLEERGLPATFFVVTGRLGQEGRVTQDPFDRLEAVLRLTKNEAVDLSQLGEGRVPLERDDCKVSCYALLSKRLRIASASERQQLLDLLRAAVDVAEADIEAYLSHEAYQSMTWDDVRDLARRGFGFGSHSRTHVAVSRLDTSGLEDEVAGSCQDLIEHLGAAAGDMGFAYPFGKAKHMSGAAVEAVRRAGYACALTMERGRNGPPADVYRMRRMVYKDLRKLDREAEEAMS